MAGVIHARQDTTGKEKINVAICSLKKGVGSNLFRIAKRFAIQCSQEEKCLIWHFFIQNRKEGFYEVLLDPTRCMDGADADRNVVFGCIGGG